MAESDAKPGTPKGSPLSTGGKYSPLGVRDGPSSPLPAPSPRVLVAKGADAQQDALGTSSPRAAGARRGSADEYPRRMAELLRGGELTGRVPGFIPWAGVPDGMDASAALVGPQQELLIPPLNFGRVCRGVYRSGFPGRKNFAFLRKLALGAVLNISEHEYPEETLRFFADNNVSWKQLKVAGNKEPFQTSEEAAVAQALGEVLAATAQRPLLVHCTKGTHRTGCVVACLRKLEEWCLTSIFDEYRRYAGTKVHLLDQQFIEFFEPSQEQRVLARRTVSER